MAKINYRKVYFVPPNQISEQEYNNIKRQLLHHPHFELDSNRVTFVEHFKKNLLAIGISIGLFILGLIITGNRRGSDSSIWNVIMGMSMVVIIIGMLMLFLEGPAYATYIKERQKYFSKLKYEIQNTRDYAEFVKVFYN